MATNQLSPGGAVAMGLVFVLAGIWPILIGTGVIAPAGMEPQTPAWVPTCAGLIFVCGGLALIVDYAIAGGVGPDGDLPPGTPYIVRVANFLLGLGIVGCILAEFAWVAFGKGERHFSSTVSLPFLGVRGQSSELSGRIAFGAGAVLIGLMFVACGVVGARRLWRIRPRAVPDRAPQR